MGVNKMKKLTKILSILVISILSLSIMTGCGKVEPADKVAQGFFDMIVHSDTTTIESVGIPEDEISGMKDLIRNAIKDNTKNNFKMGGLSISDEDLDKIADAQLGSMSKIKATITTESSDKQTAVVKIKTNYIKLTEADQKAGNDALAEVQAMGLTDQSEMSKIFVEKYVEKLVTEFNALEPVDDTVEKSFSFVIQTVQVGGKNKKMWVPENPTTLGKDISTMIAK